MSHWKGGEKKARMSQHENDNNMWPVKMIGDDFLWFDLNSCLDYALLLSVSYYFAYHWINNWYGHQLIITTTLYLINCKRIHRNTTLYVNQSVSGVFYVSNTMFCLKETNSLLQCAAPFHVTIATHHGSEKMLEKGKDGVTSIDCNMTLLPVLVLLALFGHVDPGKRYKTLTKGWL